jgi:hypothetical protein
MSTELQAPAQTQSRDISNFGLLLDEGSFNHLQRVAKMYAESTLVPDHFKKNIANCAIGIQMAMRLRMDPYMFLQHCYIVHGRPGIEGKLAIALLNSSGLIRGSIKYRFVGQGENYGCVAMVVNRDGETIEGPPVTWKLVKAEGWDKPKGTQTSKWATMPELMFHYRSAMFLVRTHFPEVLLGMLTTEELEDIGTIDVQPAPPSAAAIVPGIAGESKAERVAKGMKKKAEQASLPAPATAPAPPAPAAAPAAPPAPKTVSEEDDSNVGVPIYPAELEGYIVALRAAKNEDDVRAVWGEHVLARKDSLRTEVYMLGNQLRDQRRAELSTDAAVANMRGQGTLPI